MTRLGFDLLVPLPVIVSLAVLALLVAGWALWHGLRGWLFRGLALLAAAAALSAPALQTGARQALNDIVILIEDRSASQFLPGREAQTDAALAQLTRQIDSLPDTELRRITVTDDADGSLLGQSITRALAAEPESRVAGVIVVSDGQGHDPAMLPAAAPAPVHVLLTGQPEDWDRRLVIEEAPAFALIGQPVSIKVRVEDQGRPPVGQVTQTETLTISVDGEVGQTIAVPVGQLVELQFTPEHAGQNVVSIGFEAISASPPELTDRNNSAAVQIQGVRDRLRVLLVSGEPHAGERTWRNLLKSDSNVDLIHFTILRSPENVDMVPVNEMSLIAFPTHELFMQRIDDFDLIILDRYAVRGILPPEYFRNIARYVEDGGALLVAAGPEMASVESLNLSPLGRILPARPTGRMYQQPFLPQLTDEGRRHPVTADLPGAPPAAGEQETSGQHWGRWLRMGQALPVNGAQVALSGVDGQPLLVLNRVGKGRVAQLNSDQVWLWGRGFEGGGPQLELLRRIAHWSMKEPELEEESLQADVGRGLSVALTRRTMQAEAAPLNITGPEGYHLTLPLEPSGPGRFTAKWQAPDAGIYRLTDGQISRVVALGPAAPREFEQTVADGAMLAPLAQATRGAVLHLSDAVPNIRSGRAERKAFGQNVAGTWIAVTPRGASTIGGMTHRPLLPEWLWLVLIAGLALLGWLREGRGRWRN